MPAEISEYNDIKELEELISEVEEFGSIIAVISDVHSNIEALKAVIKDMDKYAVRGIICLGDLVNYGPDPVLTLKKLKEICGWIVKGNHDAAVADNNQEMLRNFNPLARNACHWTRKQLSKKDLQFLRGLPAWLLVGKYAFVHGTLCHKLEEDDPEYVSDPKECLEYVNFTEYCSTGKLKYNVDRCFASMKALKRRICFLGHTQLPEGFSKTVNGKEHYHKIPTLPGERNQGKAQSYTFPLDSTSRYIFSAGAVGQPRDGDRRACYFLVSNKKVILRRVPYDYKATQKKIRKIPELDDFLAQRLEEGR